MMMVVMMIMRLMDVWTRHRRTRAAGSVRTSNATARILRLKRQHCLADALSEDELFSELNIGPSFGYKETKTSRGATTRCTCTLTSARIVLDQELV